MSTYLPWMDLALCQETDPECFYVEKGGSTAAAKQVCMACEVRLPCLEYALANNEKWGVWGGMSERQRRRVLRERGTQAAGVASGEDSGEAA